jgi:hypothetical protein
LTTYTRQQIGLYDPPPPAPEPPAKRQMSAGATLLAASIMLIWPIILSLFVGVAAWVWTGNVFWLRAAFVGGIGVGVLASASTVVGSWIVVRVLAPAPVAVPQAQTITYAPLGAADNIRIVPLTSADRLIDEVREDDLRFFIEGLRLKGHTQSAWIGIRLPSGKVIDRQMWRSLSRPLRKIGVIKGVGPRRKGHLVTKSAPVILAQLGLTDHYNLE